jgi:hypothetical protein
MFPEFGRGALQILRYVWRLGNSARPVWGELIAICPPRVQWFDAASTVGGRFSITAADRSIGRPEHGNRHRQLQCMRCWGRVPGPDSKSCDRRSTSPILYDLIELDGEDCTVAR